MLGLTFIQQATFPITVATAYIGLSLKLRWIKLHVRPISFIFIKLTYGMLFPFSCFYPACLWRLGIFDRVNKIFRFMSWQLLSVYRLCTLRTSISIPRIVVLGVPIWRTSRTTGFKKMTSCCLQSIITPRCTRKMLRWNTAWHECSLTPYD